MELERPMLAGKTALVTGSTSGIGKDVGAVGDAVSDSAEKSK